MKRFGIRGVMSVAGPLICLGCDPLCLARGRIVDVDGLTGASCSVKLHHRAGEPAKYGAPCRQPEVREDDPDRRVVKLGHEFQCTTIPGLKGQAFDISVACDGYEPFRSAAFEWRVEGLTCNSIDVGTIRLRRSIAGRGSENIEGKQRAAEQSDEAAEPQL